MSRVLNFIYSFLYLIFYKAKFKSFGLDSKVYMPLRIEGKSNISIGNNVVIQYKAWIVSRSHSNQESSIEIGDGTNIGHFCHIYATKSIKIGSNVLISDKVYIADNCHEYTDIGVPILYQEINQKKLVEISDGSWIGENVCIIGAKVGRNSVVGANSVVTKDVPDFAVAVGIPARVIKKYDLVLKKWVSL